jgi:exopolysaccharide biosynthesis protein
MINRKNVNGKKKSPWKFLVFFIVFEFIFTGITAPFLVFYGPFNNVKKTIVGAAMTTLSHQYIAKTFLSDKQISEILSEDKIETVEQDGEQTLQFDNKHDSNIERYDIDSSKFKGYLLVIHDPTRVKVGVSKKLGTEGQLTSQIAKDNNAAAAINGGGFTDKSSSNSEWTGTGGQPVGIIMSNGEVKYNDVESDTQKVDVMAMTKNGVLLVGPHSLSDMKRLGVTDAISFGPAIIVSGKSTIKGDGGWGIAPRTAIGQKKDGSIIMLVIDGRQVSSVGATLKDVADIMLQYGAYNATNLDGGSSSSMYYDDEVINNPCDPLGERSVPSIVYVKP